MTLLFLLACNGNADAARADPAAEGDGCTLNASDGTADCPVDPCADRCASVADGLACCVAAHGFGEAGSAVTAGHYCYGDVSYDPGDYLTAAGAACAAQVQGLPPGVAAYRTTFGMCGDEGSWLVKNVERDDCYGAAGTMLAIDGVTGLAGSGGSWNADHIWPRRPSRLATPLYHRSSLPTSSPN